MSAERGSNPGEKRRLRERIDRQVEQYLEAGGRITVLESPGRQHQAQRARSTAWQDLGDPMSDLEEGFE